MGSYTGGRRRIHSLELPAGAGGPIRPRFLHTRACGACAATLLRKLLPHPEGG